jgi:hypothetical protein
LIDDEFAPQTPHHNKSTSRLGLHPMSLKSLRRDPNCTKCPLKQ